MADRQLTSGNSEDVWVPTACDMCYNACTVRVHRVNGVAVKIEGIPEAPPNYGKVCAKGNAGLMSLYNPHRITSPCLRTNPQKGIGVDPQWREISWDEAMDLLVEKLRAARSKDPRSLVAATFDRYSHFMLRSFLTAFGSPNLTTASAGFFCGNGMHPVAYTLTGSNDVHPDLKLCDYLLMFGTSYGFVSQANAIGLTREMAEARMRGMKLVVVDPVCSYAASQANEWIPIRPGTDAAFALSLMNVLVNELGLYDMAYLKRFTNSTYLVGPDGHYLRDPKDAKPLVWDAPGSRATTFDAIEPMDGALEGGFQLEGIEARPAFQLFMVATSGDPEIMAEALKRIPFMVSFADHQDETTQFADLLLPDTHALERLVPIVFNPYYHYNNAPLPGEEWSFNFQQPVVKPRGQARYWMEVLLEVADRLAIRGDLYTAFNAIAHLEGPCRLDPSMKYTWEEICDRWFKSYCGQEHGLAYFLQHGYCKVGKRTAEQSYPRSFHKGRVPLYLEHFIGAGEEVKKFTEEHRIPWDTSDYVALMEWRPCPAHSESPPEYDLFVVNQKLPFLNFSFSSENPWLMELAERNGKIFPVGINTGTARRKGIDEGDEIEMETPGGRKARAIARLTQGLHPECLAVPGILGRWVTSNGHIKGKGVHFNSLLEYSVDRLDSLSAALDACVKVKVNKIRSSDQKNLKVVRREGGYHD